MTSIERLTGRTPSLPEVAEVYAQHFGDVFERVLDRDLVTSSLPLQVAGT